MDVLTKMSMEHGSIYESLAVFKNLSTVFSENDQVKRIDTLKSFLKDIILPHFDYEESNVIPVVLKYGSQEEKKVAEEIRQEHVKIIEKINEFKALPVVVKNSQVADGPDAVIIALILQHAHKEDVHLYPVFKKYYKV